MSEIKVDASPAEVVRWLRAEAEGDFANFHVHGRRRRAYDIDVNRAPERLDDADPVQPVSVTGELRVEPFVEQNFWVLRVTVRRDLVPGRPERSHVEEPEIGFEEFAAEFGDAGPADGEVTVEAQTPQAQRHFQDWLDSVRRRRS